MLDTADEASLSEKERIRYESNLKAYRDTMSYIKYAETKGEVRGEARGKAEEKIEIARSMKNKGLDCALIAECTGLSVEEIGGL